MINTTTLVGRITRDPELRKTGSGKSVLNFTLAVNRPFAKDETDFINCVTWERSADFVAQYITKGALLGVVGRIQTGSYEDKETGKTIYTTDVVCDSVQALESKGERESRESGQSRPERNGDTTGKYPPKEKTYQTPNQVAREVQPKRQAPVQATYGQAMEDEPILDITSDDLPF